MTGIVRFRGIITRVVIIMTVIVVPVSRLIMMAMMVIPVVRAAGIPV